MICSQYWFSVDSLQIITFTGSGQGWSSEWRSVFWLKHIQSPSLDPISVSIAFNHPGVHCMCYIEIRDPIFDTISIRGNLLVGPSPPTWVGTCRRSGCGSTTPSRLSPPREAWTTEPLISLCAFGPVIWCLLVCFVKFRIFWLLIHLFLVWCFPLLKCNWYNWVRLIDCISNSANLRTNPIHRSWLYTTVLWFF